MANLAAQNLSALMAGNVVQAENADTVLDRITPDNSGGARVPESDEEGRAKFGTAEGIATAVIATALLGPVAGLFLGGAQGLMKRKEDQTILDAAADRSEGIATGKQIYDAQIAEIRGGLSTKEDLDQLAAIETQMEYGSEHMGSADPQLSALGASVFSSGISNLNTFMSTQDSQKIAAGVRKDAEVREIGLERSNRLDSWRSEFNVRSEDYITRQQAGNRAIEASVRGNYSDMYNAFVSFNKTLDPGSAVLGEERTAMESMGSFLTQGITVFQKNFAGKPVSAKMRRELIASTKLILGESEKFQAQLENEYTDRLSVNDYDPEAFRGFRKIANTPQPVDAVVPNDELDDLETGMQDVIEAAITGAGSVGEIASSVFGQFAQGLKDDAAKVGNFVKTFNDAVGGSPRELPMN